MVAQVPTLPPTLAPPHPWPGHGGLAPAGPHPGGHRPSHHLHRATTPGHLATTCQHPPLKLILCQKCSQHQVNKPEAPPEPWEGEGGLLMAALQSILRRRVAHQMYHYRATAYQLANTLN